MRGIACCDVAPRCRRFIPSRLLREPAAAAGHEHPASFRFVRICDTGFRGKINPSQSLFTFQQNMNMISYRSTALIPSLRLRLPVSKYVVYAISRGASTRKASSAANPLPTCETPIEFRCRRASPNRIQIIDITLFLATERCVSAEKMCFSPDVREEQTGEEAATLAAEQPHGQPANEVPRCWRNRLLAAAADMLHCRPVKRGEAG